MTITDQEAVAGQAAEVNPRSIEGGTMSNPQLPIWETQILTRPITPEDRDRGFKGTHICTAVLVPANKAAERIEEMKRDKEQRGLTDD